MEEEALWKLTRGRRAGIDDKDIDLLSEGELFGIDIGLVKEINRKIKYTEVPGAPEHIVGLYNMRGQVVTIFDVACILHKRKSDIPEGPPV